MCVRYFVFASPASKAPAPSPRAGAAPRSLARGHGSYKIVTLPTSKSALINPSSKSLRGMLGKRSLFALFFIFAVTDAFIALPTSLTRSTLPRSAAAASRACPTPRTSFSKRTVMMAGEDKSGGVTDAAEQSFIEKLTPTDEDEISVDSDAGEVQSAGRYRRRRQAARVDQKAGISKDLRFRLLEEQASPFRRFRQFLYFAAGGSAALGTLVSGTRVIAGMQGVSGVQPLSETVPNTAINVGVVAVSLGLYIWEEKRGQLDIKKITEKSGLRQQLASLQVELNDGTQTEVQNLRDSKRLVILAGTAAEVTRSINLASRASPDLQRCDLALVPYFTDLDDDSAGWNAMKEGSGTGMWDPYLIRPLGRDAWGKWLKDDKQAQDEKRGETKEAAKPSASIDRLLRVYIIRKDGKIGARTVGPPAWPKLVKQVEALPLTDQYGTP